MEMDRPPPDRRTAFVIYRAGEDGEPVFDADLFNGSAESAQDWRRFEPIALVHGKPGLVWSDSQRRWHYVDRPTAPPANAAAVLLECVSCLNVFRLEPLYSREAEALQRESSRKVH